MIKIFAKVVIIVTLFFGGFYIGRQTLSESKISAIYLSEKTEQQDENQMQVSLMLDFGDGKIKTYTDVNLNQGSKVFDLLETVTLENDLKFKYKDNSGFGVFIESIDNATNDFKTNRFWQYWVNNSYAKVGASSYQLQNGDVVEWKYIKGQY